MFSRLFTLALLVLVDLPVDAAPVLNSDLNRMEETRKEHEKTLRIYRELAQKNPQSYLPEVAQMLNNLGLIHSAQDRMAEARKEFEETLKTYRKLAQKYPETYLPDVGLALNNLGILYSDKHQTEEARRA